MKNPANSWPFKSETFSAQNITVGKYRLNEAQVYKLGQAEMNIEWDDEGEQAIANTKDAMAQSGFSTLVRRNNYFVSSTEDNDDEKPHVGQYRIRFHYCPCSTVTIMAQQVQDNDNQ